MYFNTVESVVIRTCSMPTEDAPPAGCPKLRRAKGTIPRRGRLYSFGLTPPAHVDAFAKLLEFAEYTLVFIAVLRNRGKAAFSHQPPFLFKMLVCVRPVYQTAVGSHWPDLRG